VSYKEIKRRKVLHYVMKKAWYLFKRSTTINFSEALGVAWKIVRGYDRLKNSKVYGTSFNNRQSILRSLINKDNFKLQLIRDKNNKHDYNAIKIIAITEGINPSTLGYVKRELADQIAPLLDSGKKILAIPEGITGIAKGFLGSNFTFIII